MTAMENPTDLPEFERKDAGFGRSTEVKDEDAPREPAGIVERRDSDGTTDEGDQR